MRFCFGVSDVSRFRGGIDGCLVIFRDLRGRGVRGDVGRRLACFYGETSYSWNDDQLFRLSCAET